MRAEGGGCASACLYGTGEACLQASAVFLPEEDQAHVRVCPTNRPTLGHRHFSFLLSSTLRSRCCCEQQTGGWLGLCGPYSTVPMLCCVPTGLCLSPLSPPLVSPCFVVPCLPVYWNRGGSSGQHTHRAELNKILTKLAIFDRSQAKKLKLAQQKEAREEMKRQRALSGNGKAKAGGGTKSQPPTAAAAQAS